MLYKRIKLRVDKRLLKIICDSYNGFRRTVGVYGIFFCWFIPEKIMNQEDTFYVCIVCA